MYFCQWCLACLSLSVCFEQELQNVICFDHIYFAIILVWYFRLCPTAHTVCKCMGWAILQGSIFVCMGGSLGKFAWKYLFLPWEETWTEWWTCEGFGNFKNSTVHTLWISNVQNSSEETRICLLQGDYHYGSHPEGEHSQESSNQDNTGEPMRSVP